MGVTRRKLKGLDLSKSNNYGTNSMLFFEAVLSAMEISLWKSQRLITWSPQRVIYLRERKNYPSSMLCVDVKYHFPVHGGCI